jgi:dUTP pyrophosphatase
MEIGFMLKDGALPPVYKTDGASGADICAFISDPVTIMSGSRALIPTGVFAEIPTGYEIQVRPRSGLALKYGITVLNSPGTIDSDYRGEIGIVLVNHGDKPFVVENGERIAQIVVAAVHQVSFVQKGKLSETDRGEGGYGSTGKK